ncbi:MAG: asparagine--tRNA ligase [Lachnospiraceae bacterium]|nr:asparagine--tRNA ligase [Lachnospiraceae bacterium]
MECILIRDLYKDPAKYTAGTITVTGWVRSIRDSKALGFIVLHDGTCFNTLQIIYEASNVNNFDEISHAPVGSSMIIEGTLLLTPEAKQPFELHASKVTIEGLSTSDYPLQKKRHTMEYLRTIGHLRPRTNTFQAVFRVRSLAAFAIHKFFQEERNFVYVNTPIITGSDAEGAGEMFQLSTLDMNKLPLTEEGKVNYSEDFFGKMASLTVSGQLNAETYATAFRNVYTFGPTFRAENSNTPRHAAEFWMMEPEICFADLADVCQLEEDMLKYVVGYLMEHAKDELNFFNSFVDKGLLDRLSNILAKDFVRCTYTHAIELLQASGQEFEYRPEWGIDLQTEHERYLTEVAFEGTPVFVTDYPKEIKAFYMRLNDDGKTVAAADLLVPGVGELCGGSQREERLELLEKMIRDRGMKEEDYWWYLDLRRYGTVKHGGFGLGFERLIMYVTGMSNIRDVIPFPRTVGNLDF